jgi:hypothetical protein
MDVAKLHTLTNPEGIMLQNLSLEGYIYQVKHNSDKRLELTMCIFPNDLGVHQLASATSGHPRDKQLDRLEIKIIK